MQRRKKQMKNLSALSGCPVVNSPNICVDGRASTVIVTPSSDSPDYRMINVVIIRLLQIYKDLC